MYALSVSPFFTSVLFPLADRATLDFVGVSSSVHASFRPCRRDARSHACFFGSSDFHLCEDSRLSRRPIPLPNTFFLFCDADSLPTAFDHHADDFLVPDCLIEAVERPALNLIDPLS